MIYRKFKDLQISGLGLGMMRLPTINGQDAMVDEAAAAELVDYAIQNGVNYFDTAYVYHHGNSEAVTGRLLAKYPRESYYLATKFPGFNNADMPRVAEIFEEQLQRCQTGYFDFYLFHNVNENNIEGYLDPKNGILDYLLQQKQNGRIRHLGFSTHGSLALIQRFLREYGEHMEFCQLQLNYMDWHFQSAKQVAEMLQKAGIPIWVMEPLRGGKLATAPENIEAEMHRMRPEETVPGWAFRFLQSIPGVGVVLSGMSNMEQLRANVETWKEDRPLSKEEFDTLVALMDEETRKGDVPCTACRYCLKHCPKQLPIPDLIAQYNKQKSAENSQPESAAALPAEQLPANCIGCHSCEQVCPQRIKIADIMHTFADMLNV